MSYFLQLRSLNRSKRCCFYLITVFLCSLLGYVAITNYLFNLDKYEKIVNNNENLYTKSIPEDTLIIKDHKNRKLHINYKVHVFYYAWYANPEIDGEYRHWNHQYLPTWNKNDHNIYPKGHHYPPNDIGSNFYPALGCYSSNDANIIEMHMKLLNEAEIGVVALSWRPENEIDSPNRILRLFFDTAEKHNLKVTLHIEPYENRNPENLKENLKMFLNEFNNHTALYKVEKQLGSKKLPLFYIYDSYLTISNDWKTLLSNKGEITIRGTENDAILIGLLADVQHRNHITDSGFDGFYTYFASNGFTYGSSWKNWKALAKFAFDNNLMFIPSVGPGYIDTQVRPWNSENTKHRRKGQYYNMAWKTALENYIQYISITSFNEWHEGTQIEPTVSKNLLNFVYLDYEPEGINFYMNLTRKWANEFL